MIKKSEPPPPPPNQLKLKIAQYSLIGLTQGVFDNLYGLQILQRDKHVFLK